MKVALVTATLADSARVFAWRNDPQTRRFSINPEEISWDDHGRWFDGVLADQSRHLLIAKDDRGEVGVFRLDMEDGTAEISIYLVPGLAGRGYGTAILDAGINWAKDNLTAASLTAKVAQRNEASVRLFAKAGFALIGETDGWLAFRKELRR